ncbi:MAG: lipid-A-disaccharide synthase [Actinomycetota bacterium]|nr:lipid-A-disaccharide synthase [Actinomycetota bacterium]
MSEPTFFISAGEASGEHYGALLIAALQARLHSIGQSASFYGMGGDRMAAAGLNPGLNPGFDRIVRSEDMAVMGITEVLHHLPRIYCEFRKLKSAIRRRPPSVAILIDFPDIHFRLAAQLHRLGVPVLFFVSPQLWAWKKHRIKLVQKYVDEMLVIFPFEEQFYLDHGVRARFVGHPLADLPLPSISRADFALQHQLDPTLPWIGLLPGSRAREIRDNLPEILRAADLLLRDRGPAQFLIPLAPTLTAAQRAMTTQLVGQLGQNLTVRFTGDARATLHHARASVVASGTATVEAALIGNPFVVVYRVSPLTYAIAQRVVTVPHVAMANLIAGRRAVPELIQGDFTAANIVLHLAPLLPDGSPRQSMMQDLARIRALLALHPPQGQPAASAVDRVATIALAYAGLASPLQESVSS